MSYKIFSATPTTRALLQRKIFRLTRKMSPLPWLPHLAWQHVNPTRISRVEVSSPGRMFIEHVTPNTDLASRATELSATVISRSLTVIFVAMTYWAALPQSQTGAPRYANKF